MAELEAWPTPLAGLPSLLALRDLRGQVRRALIHEEPGATTLTRLLALDPPSLLRCMRALHTPLHGQTGHVLGIPELVARLGVPFVQRAIGTPAAHAVHSERLRKLWLHSVFTAVAARELALLRGSLDPERAYVLGLLHDLNGWAREVGRWRGQSSNHATAEEWITRWNLPLELANGLRTGNGDDFDLIRTASTLADRAGYPPPLGEGPREEITPAVASMEDLVRANGLRGRFEELLARFGLSSHGPTGAGDPQGRDDLLFPGRTRGGIAELCASLATGHRSARVRKLLTASTEAALSHLDFERAHALRWAAGLNRCWIRASADLTMRALDAPLVQPTPAERVRLTAALNTGRPQVLVAELEASGLMATLGADEALLVPLNATFQLPTLLVLDRAVSGVRIEPGRDGRATEALGSIVSLLQENLLLNRQRKRAVKFSLTDPLTRLSNRGVGIHTLRQEISRSNRTAAPMTVLMLDLDRFKLLNDEYGHVVGDQALRTAGEVLRRGIRRMDTAVRYGGEEFLVILPGTGLDEAAVIATRVQVAVAAAGDALGLPLSVSIGLAGFIHGEDTVESILSRADRALYASKGRGRNRFSIDVEGAMPT